MMKPPTRTWTSAPKEYKGKVYIRPCQRGWCVYDSNGYLGNDLDEYLNLGEGDYYIELKVGPLDSPPQPTPGGE